MQKPMLNHLRYLRFSISTTDAMVFPQIDRIFCILVANARPGRPRQQRLCEAEVEGIEEFCSCHSQFPTLCTLALSRLRFIHQQRINQVKAHHEIDSDGHFSGYSFSISLSPACSPSWHWTPLLDHASMPIAAVKLTRTFDQPHKLYDKLVRMLNLKVKTQCL